MRKPSLQTSALRFLGVPVLIFGAGACLSGEPGTEPSGADADFCERGCALIASLDCPGVDSSQCESNCLDNVTRNRRDYPSCSSAIGAYQECVGSRPKSDWECKDGYAGLNEGICQVEADSANACIIPGGDECEPPCQEQAPLCGVTVTECLRGCTDTNFPELSADEQDLITTCLSNAEDCDQAQSCLASDWPSGG